MNIDKLSRQYVRQGVFLVTGLCMVGLLIMQVWRMNALLTPLIIGTLFSLIVETLDGVVWGKVAKGSPESLPTFFMAVSGFRMLAALAVMLVYYLTADASMGTFLIVFAVFYVVQMLHHTLFFSQVSNKK